MLQNNEHLPLGNSINDRPGRQRREQRMGLYSAYCSYSFCRQRFSFKRICIETNQVRGLFVGGGIVILFVIW